MANNKFKAAVKKAKGLYKTGRYANFGLAVKAAHNILSRKPARRKAATKRGKRRRVTGIKKVSRVGAVRRKPAKRIGRKPVALSKRAAIELSLGKAYVRYIKADTVKATKAAAKQKTSLIKKLKSL